MIILAKTLSKVYCELTPQEAAMLARSSVLMDGQIVNLDWIKVDNQQLLAEINTVKERLDSLKTKIETASDVRKSETGDIERR